MKKEIVALALALCLLLGCFGCQSEQKDIYDQFAGSGTSQEESQAEESAAPEGEGDPGGGPLRGADHLGEVPHLGEQRPGDGGRGV